MPIKKTSEVTKSRNTLGCLTHMQLHLLIISCLLIASCQHTKPGLSSEKLSTSQTFTAHPMQQDSSAKDGAPAGPMPTHFDEQTPTNEPLSRYGNPASYQVRGYKYDVLTSSEGYKKKGIASWYGTKFHKERTSSGEAYDMYALTAAHKTLPLPTYVRVKNLENGRETIVKVNDRGPFHEDRLIDLSYGAAVKLDLLTKGTAAVEIEALNSAPEAQYYLQVGAFQSSEKADALREKLLQLKLDANVQLEERNARYVINLGPFSDKQTSDAFKHTLEEKGYPGGFSYLQ
ncbi:MAG: septal ring lytic transglycosylase RlpA family protein [Legionellaceae bacterium]|nr:septal ring lytic transglycosylase RlpA family protein [Legionellaceae bacterium]